MRHPNSAQRLATSALSHVSRRDFLNSLVGLVAAGGRQRRLLSPSGLAGTRLRVRNPQQSVEWYQTVFGLSVAARHDRATTLRTGAAPQYVAIDRQPSQRPSITQIGISLNDFDANEALKLLRTRGIPGTENGTGGRRGNAELRRSDFGPWGVSVHDPNGIEAFLQPAPRFGATEPGHDRRTAEATGSRTSRVLTLQGFNHFTAFVRDQTETVGFYRQLFEMPIDTYQGRMPLLRVGQGNEFLAFVAAGGRTEFRPFIHHVCFSVAGFEPERVLKALTKLGIKRSEPLRGQLKPLHAWVTMRMPDRGGAPAGTPELYLTDPDGILLQLQDIRYSGGSGYLGETRGTSQAK